MKILNIISFATLFFSLSACCEPQLTASYLLTDFEKSLITTTDYHDLIYLESSGQRFLATTQPRERVIYTQSERGEKCGYTEHERMWTFINVERKGFSIKVEIDLANGQNFWLYKYTNDSASSDAGFNLNCGVNSLPLEYQITDISISGFNFKNVFVFEDCSKKSDITRIIYSAKNGIELIEFKNGNYYKLNVSDKISSLD